MPRSLLWIICSIALTGCGLKRPDVYFMVVNTGKNVRCGYNLQKDYDKDGNIIAGHPMTCFGNSALADLDKATVLDSDPTNNPEHFAQALGDFKAYVKNLRESYDNGCKPPN